MEKIGQVILDDTLYPGKDLYTDGAIEDEMLEIDTRLPGKTMERSYCRAGELADSLSFFSYQGKYTELDSVYR